MFMCIRMILINNIASDKFCIHMREHMMRANALYVLSFLKRMLVMFLRLLVERWLAFCANMGVLIFRVFSIRRWACLR